MRKKRVLIYGINYWPEPTGVGRYTGEFGKYLADGDVDVDVITAIPHYPGWAKRDGYRNRYSVSESGGLRVTRCPLFLRGKMRGLWRLFSPLSFAALSAPIAIWRILTWRPDIVLCVEPTLLSAPIGIVFAKLIGARTVLHVQDLEIDAAFAVGHLHGRVLHWTAGWFERTVLNAFDEVVTISNAMRHRLESKGVLSSRLSVVRNWVSFDKIKPLGRPSIYRGELDIAEDSFVALYAGNIGVKQGLSIVLEAAQVLVTERRLIFVIAGEGPEKNNLVASYGRLPNVKFLPIQPEERLCELMNLADVHLLPQTSGTASLVLPSKLGAMLASGKSSIVMADPGTELAEFLDGAASLVPPSDIGQLVAAIRKLMSADQRDIGGYNNRHVSELDANRNLAALKRITFGSTSDINVVAGDIPKPIRRESEQRQF